MTDQFDAVLSGSGREHACAAKFRELDSQRSHTPRSGVDDDVFVPLNLEGVVNALYCSEADRGNRARLLQRETPGYEGNIVLCHRDVLRIKAALRVGKAVRVNRV